ncbi:MAG: DNA polymerase III subunit delta [Pseudomonadota bacterium]
MTPAQVVAEAKARSLRPIYLVAGSEAHFVDEVVKAVRAAALEGAVPGLNEDVFDAAEHRVEQVLAAARTLPMMAPRRLVIVRQVERWEPKGGAQSSAESDDGAKAGDEKKGEKKASDEKKSASSKDAFERLLEYAEAPSPTTTLLLVAGALDKRRRFVQAAMRAGYLVNADPLGRAELPGFVERLARERGNELAAGVADMVAELSGPDLGAVVDAVERLCLYAGRGQTVTEDMVAECVVRLRGASVWELTNAVARRDVAAALTALADVFDPSESVRLVALLAWSTRQLLRFESALRQGASPNEAAQRAGAPPFRARELAQQVRAVPRATLEGWLVTLADMDRALKGASRLPSRTILEKGILELCGKPAGTSATRRGMGA